MEILERLFRLKEAGTTPLRELVAGLTTFATMSYIIFVQPAVLGAAGMPQGAVMVATCLSSAMATLLMALLANYPVALAPAMGHNFFFAYTVVLAMGIHWQAALGAVFISGVLFILLSAIGLREKIIEIVPASLKHSIACGIGLLIALVGLEWAGIVTAQPGTFIGLGNLSATPTVVAIIGFLITAGLMALGFRGAILTGIIVSAIVGLFTGVVEYRGVLSPPPSVEPTFLKLDVWGALSQGLFTVIFVFFFLDLFDTVGTLIGVAEEGGFMKDGKLPRAREALLSDAAGTVAGSLLGTSTVTSYIESASGIGVGGRTGLTSVVVAILFVLALFFSPLVKMIGSGYRQGETTLYPVIAPALIVVGSLMLRGIRLIDWTDPTESLPAFITLITMPVTFSITEGIGFGFITYTVLKLFTGRLGDGSPLVHTISVLFLVRYLFFMG